MQMEIAVSPTPSISQRLTDLARVLCNTDSGALKAADAALLTDAPAFWSTTADTNAMSGWRDYINANGGIRAGLIAVRNDFPHTRVDDVMERFLDRLIPLNDEAIVDLEFAYKAIGTFRDEAELEAREATAFETGNPHMPLPADELAALRSRFDARQAEIDKSRALVRGFGKRLAVSAARAKIEERV